MTTDITELAQSHELRNKVNHRLYAALEFQGTSGEHATISLSIDECKSVIAALDERLALEKAQEEAEELSKFKEVMTSAAEALKAGKPLNLESLFKGELASAMFAMMFAGEFVRSGATNYLELLYDVPEFGEMTVTLQKVEGKTPGQRIAELEESHAQVIQSRDHYKRMTEEGLKRLAESRTVKLPADNAAESESPEDDAVAWFGEGWNARGKADKEALTAAGIKWEAE